MLTRIITGVVLAPLVVVLFLVGPHWLQGAVFVVVTGISLAELFGMTMPERALERWVGVALGVAVLVSLWRRPESDVGDFFAMLFVPALLVVLRPLPIERAALRLLTMWAALVYVVAPLKFGIDLATAEHPWMLYVLAAVWIGDTSAYFTGKALGRHKLHPTVSPNKTWEGAVGGLVGSALGAWAMTAILHLPLDPLRALGFGALGGVIAQVGDLAESLLKRSAGVKDSGVLLPGHGGMLDRIDGVLFALPFFALVLPA